MTYKPKKMIKDKAAKEMFKVLIDELDKNDKLNDKTILIVDNMVYLEQLKQQHHLDIEQRGVIEHFVNGSQEFMRENKSVDKILKIVEQQRKLQSELRLTPSSDKTVIKSTEEDDEFDKF